MANKSQLSINLKIDSKELIYDVEYSSFSKAESKIMERLIPLLLEHKVQDVYRYSRSSLVCNSDSLSNLNGNRLTLDKCLSLIRLEIKKYLGEIETEKILNPKLRENLLCRCNGLGTKELNHAYIEHGGNIKKVYQSTNVAGICGACFKEVDDYLIDLESQEDKLFNHSKAQWESDVKKLIDEYYLVCPPEFSNLKFELVNISSRAIKIKCIRIGEFPARHLIQDSLNSFFKDQLSENIPISVFI